MKSIIIQYILHFNILHQACGLFSCAWHHPPSHEPLSCALLTLRRDTLRLPGSSPLKNSAWLSCALREPTNIFLKGNYMATPHSTPATATALLSDPAASTPPSGRTPERQGRSSPSLFHGPPRTRRATGRPHRRTA